MSRTIMHRTVEGIRFTQSISGWVAEVEGYRVRLVEQSIPYPGWRVSYLAPQPDGIKAHITSARRQDEAVRRAVRALQRRKACPAQQS